MIFTRYKFVVVALAVFAMSACSSGDAATPSPSTGVPAEPTPTPAVSVSNGIARIVIHLSSVEGEGQIGSAILTSDGTTTTVEIEISPISGEAQPIHIHVGKCEDVGSVLHALENVVNGSSTTIINTPLDEILSGDVLVNVHASYADVSNYTACGQLPEGLR